jgi:hypothetical protein
MVYLAMAEVTWCDKKDKDRERWVKKQFLKLNFYRLRALNRMRGKV